jgi:hypothetical protein
VSRASAALSSGQSAAGKRKAQELALATPLLVRHGPIKVDLSTPRIDDCRPGWLLCYPAVLASIPGAVCPAFTGTIDGLNRATPPCCGLSACGEDYNCRHWDRPPSLSRGRGLKSNRSHAWLG